MVPNTTMFINKFEMILRTCKIYNYNTNVNVHFTLLSSPIINFWIKLILFINLKLRSF